MDIVTNRRLVFLSAQWLLLLLIYSCLVFDGPLAMLVSPLSCLGALSLFRFISESPSWTLWAFALLVSSGVILFACLAYLRSGTSSKLLVGLLTLLTGCSVVVEAFLRDRLDPSLTLSVPPWLSFGLICAGQAVIATVAFKDLSRNRIALGVSGVLVGFTLMVAWIAKDPLVDLNPLFADFQEGLQTVRIGEKWGYVDQTYKLVIKPRFCGPSEFSEGLAVHSLECKEEERRVGYINRIGEFVITPQFEEGGRFSEGFAVVKLQGKFGYIDRSGKVAINPVYEDAGDFSEGLAPVQKNGAWGFIDQRGEYVIAPQFSLAARFHEGLAVARVKANCQGTVSWKFGFIDKSGQFAIPAQYEEASAFKDGRALVRLGQKYGYADAQGRLAVDATYEAGRSFSDGLASVRINGSWRYIDGLGHKAISEDYYVAKDFRNGEAIVRSLNGKWKRIDGFGNRIIAKKHFADYVNASRRWLRSAWQVM